MDDFYMYVSVFALIVLIIVLIIIGVSLSALKKTDNFPPYQNTCPEYWDISSNPMFCGIPSGDNAVNRGGFVFDPANNALKMDDTIIQKWGSLTEATGKLLVSNTQDPQNASKQKSWIRLNGDSADAGFSALYPGYSSRCAKKKWSMDNKVVWDGVTNFNNCSV